MPESNAIINKIKMHLRQTLDALIPAKSICALIDFPQYSNVGDSAIWLGEIAYLKQRQCQIRYVCDCTNYNPKALASIIGTGIILLQGGGNFGDLYPRHQKLRECVLNDFPNNRIIQLPQSIFFSDLENLALTQKFLSAHQDFHFVVRDKPSFSFAQKHFINPLYLCPDMAMMLDLKPLKNRSKSTDVVILSRSDNEKATSFDLSESLPFKYHVTDWLDEPIPKLQILYDWTHLRLGWGSKVPRILLNQLNLYAANAMAKERLDRGLNILGEGNFVITDRLHALILSWLGKTPVSFVDNNYGKLSNYIDAWLSDSDGQQQCDSLKEALELTSNLIKTDSY